MRFKATASFIGSDVPWHGVLKFDLERAPDESRKAFSLRASEEARKGFTVLAAAEPGAVIVTEETFSL